MEDSTVCSEDKSYLVDRGWSLVIDVAALAPALLPETKKCVIRCAAIIVSSVEIRRRSYLRLHAQTRCIS